MGNKKQFETGVVLTVAQPRCACNFGDAQELMEHMAGTSVWTHQIPRISPALQEEIRRQLPWLNEVADAFEKRLGEIVEKHQGNRGTIVRLIDAEVGAVSAKHGESHWVEEVADPTALYRNPLKEAEEIFGKDKVIPVQL